MPQGTLALGLAMLSACGWGHPQRPPIASPPAIAHSEYVPEAWRQAVDRSGPALVARVRTSSLAQGPDGLEVLGEGEEDDALREGQAVASVLAVTGTVTFDLPMSEDERVLYWVDFLSQRGRRSFSRWLGRSTRYVPLFWSILEQYNLPKDLVFLSMIESGFSPRAYSWAHAAGAWQFMPYTGRRFGLKVGFWVDERRDFVKATHAAAQYLSRLHAMFDDWWLAMAAYNAGPGRMRSAIRRLGTDDFWKISRSRHLRRETKHYVPKLLAAARVAKQPERYGFEDVTYLPPLTWDVLTVTVATDLQTLSKACGLATDKPLLQLNPELRCGVTPPGQAYALRVPKDTEPTCRAGLLALNPAVRMTYRYALLKEQETLQALAERHHTTGAAITSFNRMQEEQLADLAEIVVPVPLLQAHQVPLLTPDPKLFRGGIYRPDGQQLIVHRVRSGDSLWRIARRYRVGVKKLRLWNGLWRGRSLRIGQRIKVFVGRGRAPSARSYKSKRTPGKVPASHRIRSGQSLWSVAERYGLSVAALRRLNKLAEGAILQVGQVLRLR